MAIDPSLSGPVSGDHKIQDKEAEDFMSAYLGSYFMSTMSPSQWKKFVSSIIDSSPQLPPPRMVDIADLAQADIVKQQLDSWGKQLEQEKEKRREWLNSAAYKHELEIKSTPYRAKEDAKVEDNTSTTAGFKHALSNFLEGVEKPTIDDVMIISAGVAALSVGTVGPESTYLMGTHAIQDSVNKTISPFVPPEFQDSSQLTINLFVVGLATSTVAEAAIASRKQTDQEFARSFGEKTIQKVNDPNDPVYNFLNTFLIDKAGKGEPVSAEKTKEIAMISKLVMLSVALLMIYKLSPQYIKEGGFEGMLNGSFELEPGSTEAKLAGQINALVNQFPPEKERLSATPF